LTLEKSIWAEFCDEQELISDGGRQGKVPRALFEQIQFFPGSEQNKKRMDIVFLVGERNRYIEQFGQ